MKPTIVSTLWTGNPALFVAVWTPQSSSWSFAKFAFWEATTQWFSALSWSNALQWKTCSWRFGSGRRHQSSGNVGDSMLMSQLDKWGETGPLSRILPRKWCFPSLESHWAHWSCSHFQVPGVWSFAKRVQLLKISGGVPRGSGVPLHETGGFVSRNKGLVKSCPNEFLTCRNMDGIGIFTYL